MLYAPQRRSGFTLLELLVVIALIVLLASLTVGAVFRLVNARRETNTNTHLLKIHSQFEQQYRAGIDTIKKESVPEAIKQGTKTGAGSVDNARARALHLKLRLRQEFPQSFVEADQAKFQVAYPNASSLYPPKRSFSAVSGVNGLSVDDEAAVLLYLILSQGRGGATTDVDGIAKTMILPGTNFRVFIDEFGDRPDNPPVINHRTYSYANPISFRRWLDQTDQMSSSDAYNELANISRDVQDPDGRLGQGGTITWEAPANRLAAIDLFVPRAAASGARPNFTVNGANPLDGINRGPLIFSAGKNGVYMDFDDLLSFRLQQSGKGN